MTLKHTSSKYFSKRCPLKGKKVDLTGDPRPVWKQQLFPEAANHASFEDQFKQIPNEELHAVTTTHRSLTSLIATVVLTLTSPLSGQESPRPSDFINYEGEHCDIAFPKPVPMMRYRVKIETNEIAGDGLRGWSAALPVYGDDIFAVDCYDVTSPALKNQTDHQILQALLPSISGLENLLPDKRTVGIEKWPGNEFIVNYNNGTRSRVAYCRHKQNFYMLIAMCADSQPGIHPDPFASDFALSPNIDYFFN